MNKHKITLFTLLMTGATGITSVSMSAELEYVWRAGAAYSDNIERMPSGLEESASSAVVGIEMHGERPTGRLRYEVETDIAYYHYLDGDLDPEVLGRAMLRGAYDFIPDTFSWNAAVSFDQVRDDILRPLAPGNVDEQLMYSTGPTFRVHFSNTVEALLEASYSRLEYGSQPYDNETIGGRALLARRANPGSMVALGVSVDDVSYISTAGASALDYKRQEAFGRVEIDRPRTEMELEAGYADVSGPSIDDNGPLLRARLMRRVTPMLSVHLSGVREYPTSDSTAISQDPTNSGSSAYDTSLLTSAPRIATSVEAGLRLDRPRTQAELTYLYSEDDSLITSLGERDYDEIRARVSRDFTPKATGSLYASMSNEDYSAFVREFDELVFGGSLAITFGRALGLELRIEHRDRDGVIPLDEYSELSGGLYIRYAGSVGRE